MAGQKAENSYVNIFDFIAERIQHVYKLNPEACESKDFRETIVQPGDLDDEVSALFDAHPCLNVSKTLIRRGISYDTAAAIYGWKYNESFPYVYEFLLRLTRKIPVGDIIRYSAKVKEKGGFEALNNNVRKTGIQITLKVKSINDPLEPARETGEEEGAADGQKGTGTNEKHWASDRLPGINEDLSNVMYIEPDKLEVKGEHYKVVHHIVNRDFFAGGKKELVVGVSPLARDDVLKTSYEVRDEGAGPRRFFNVTGLKQADLVQDKIIAAAMEACDQGVDILMYAEMFGSRETVSEDFVRQMSDLAGEAGLPMPVLILLPTWWHDHSNELYVMEGSGALVSQQQKQYPFAYTDEETGERHAEDLQMTERVIHVVHIPGLGRLTFPICRDYLQPEYLRLMAELLRSTFLLCPSYSRGKTQFDLTAPGEIKYGCYTVWINTCAATHDKPCCPSYVGLVSGPLAEGDYIKRLEPTCGGNCGGGQDACLFVIRISMDHFASISYTHVHSDNI